MIKIIADSTCDLSNELIEKYDIGIAPLSITLDQVSYLDRVDIQPDDLYNRLMSLKTQPTTAMPSPAKFLELMEKALEDGFNEILCICMSSGTSGSYQSAMIAKEMFCDQHDETQARVHVVDSLCMSHGSGYLILKSAIFRENGMSFDELIEFNETFKKNIKHFLSVDDLDNLIRSGRLTNASAFIGKLLKIKPIMSMRDGKGAIVAKERGRKMVLDHYIREFNRRIDLEMTDFVIVGYTSDQSVAENLKERIFAETEFKGEMYIMQMGVSVGVHVGLGGLSMYFIEKDRAHDGLLVNEFNSWVNKRDAFINKMKNYKK